MAPGQVYVQNTMQQLNWIRQINSPLRKDISGLSRQWEMSSQNHQEKRNLERSSGPTLCLRQNCSSPPKTEHQPMELPEISKRVPSYHILPPLASIPKLVLPPSWFNPAFCPWNPVSLLWFIISPSSKFIPHSISCLFISYSTSPINP